MFYLLTYLLGCRFSLTADIDGRQCRPSLTARVYRPLDNDRGHGLEQAVNVRLRTSGEPAAINTRTTQPVAIGNCL